ncbi:MAG TPA: tRNA dihydrouridine synthase DusB [Firmicutes bacterium]|nr:tRNA dihydrouridine synthase DusB [Bacillota bacterium]
MLIRNVNIVPPVVLAPMAGVTDLPFRILAKEMGCGLVCGEMVSDKALVYGNSRTVEMLRIAPEERPVSIQLFGSDPETIAKAARILAEYKPEIIDINMGCPVPKVVKNGEGSALMRDPERAAAIVAAVVESVSCPVTVKMRKGWDEEKIMAPELARRVVAAGAAAVTVHGRTREQFYAGRADWSVIRAVKETVDVPVIGNGDIFTPEDAVRMLEETGCDGVMIGRGAQGNPWIFREVAHYLQTGEKLSPPSVAERFAVIRRHFRAVLEYAGEDRGIREMRKHIGWYFKGLPDAARMRDRVNQLTEAETILSLLDEYERDLG